MGVSASFNLGTFQWGPTVGFFCWVIAPGGDLTGFWTHLSLFLKQIRTNYHVQKSSVYFHLQIAV